MWTFGLLASVPWNPAVPDAVDEEETYRIIYNIYIYRPFKYSLKYEQKYSNDEVKYPLL